MTAPIPVAIAPQRPEWIVDAARAAGVEIVAPAAARALIWTEPADPAALARLLDAQPRIEWIQLPWAGVEPYTRAGVVDRRRQWCGAKGVYSRPVAEHALALALAGMRDLKRHALRAEWGPQAGTSLYGATVTIVGRGGIATELARLLRPFECTIVCVARTGAPVGWADRVVAVEDRADAIAGADLIVLALSLSPPTEGLFGRKEFARMKSTGWLVNVARGRHVDTDALAEALRAGRIGGAAMDVTDPEPLPPDHPLWTLPNCVITPHTAVTAEMSRPLLASRITENLRRFAGGEPPLGLIDPVLGY